MEFKWLNESTVKQSGDRIEILAPGKTDFFCGSMDECQEGILPESLWCGIKKVDSLFSRIS